MVLLLVRNVIDRDSGARLLRPAEFIRAARHLRLDRRGSSGCRLALYVELGTVKR